MFNSAYFVKSVCSLFFAVLFVSAASAKNVADIEIPDQASVDGVEKKLVLNGAGIRSKFFFDIYIGALYLAEKSNNAESILNSSAANRITMHFLYDEVAKKKLVNAWIDGFEENTSANVFKSLSERLASFNEMFSDLHQGDVVLLDYLPAKGTRVTIKGEVKGIIAGEDFNRALLSVWLGEEPVTESLKEAMLGED